MVCLKEEIKWKIIEEILKAIQWRDGHRKRILDDPFGDWSFATWSIHQNGKMVIEIAKEMNNFIEIIYVGELIPDQCFPESVIHFNLKKINRSKIDELKDKLEKIKQKYPKLTEPIIRKDALELISKIIGNEFVGTKIREKLIDCGVDEDMIIYPNTKWKMINEILSYLVISNKIEDRQTLAKIIETFCHPLLHSNDKEKSINFLDKINNALKYDGFFVNQNDYKLYESTRIGDKKEEQWIQVETGEIYDFDTKKIDLKNITEISIGNLCSYSDGTIRYDGKVIEMRVQMKDLCRLFMERKGQLITMDDIKDAIIKADKRDNTSNTTISKYVSELNKLLKEHFKKNVFINQEKEGWRFSP